MNRTTRRGAIGAALAVVTVSSSSSAKKEESSVGRPSKNLGSFSSLSEGEVREVEYPEGHSAFLVRLRQSAEGGIGKESQVVAFHRACPHQGCALTTLDDERGELGPCACHLSRFDLKRGGAQISGLASQNLVQLILEEEDGDAIATGVRGLPYGDALTEEKA